MRNFIFLLQESEEEDPEKPSPGKPKSGMYIVCISITIDVASILID